VEITEAEAKVIIELIVFMETGDVPLGDTTKEDNLKSRIMTEYPDIKEWYFHGK
jgi:hypothetical protein